MASKNRVGHGGKKPAQKSLREKRLEKRAKHDARRVQRNRPVEKTLSHAR